MLFFASIVSFFIKPEPPPMFSHWSIVPDVRLCSDSEVTPERLGQALRWWEHRGMKFGEVIYSDCDEALVYPGEIVLTDFDDEQLRPLGIEGVTYIVVWTDETLLQTEVAIPVDNLDRMNHVLEHELGHAIGFGHHYQFGHVMHPYKQLGGWNHQGCRKALRQSRNE